MGFSTKPKISCYEPNIKFFYFFILISQPLFFRPRVQTLQADSLLRVSAVHHDSAQSANNKDAEWFV